MSLFQALNIGVSGLQSQSNKLGVISDNISNQNTIGYKGGIASFTTMVNEFSGSRYTAGGVRSGFQQTNQKKGLITATDSATDLAISGRGFFPVSDRAANGGDISYTRAGSFNTNQNGDYLNSNGFFLKGWRLDNNGNLPTILSASTLEQSAAEAALVTVNVRNLTVAAIPTTGITIRANLKSTETALPNNTINYVGSLIASQTALPSTTAQLTANLQSTETLASARVGYAGYDPLDNTKNMASGAVAPHFTAPMTVYDASGAARGVKVSYLKTAANTWAVEISSEISTNITPAVGLPAGLISSGNITFNSDGTLATVSPALTTATNIAWNSPASTNAITFDFGTVGATNGLWQSTSSYTGINTANPSYNPAISASSMTSGAVTPHYSTTVSITDNTGTARNVSVNFVKTAANTWGIEVAAIPATALATSNAGVTGQIASGTATFNADGSLASISSSIANPIAVDWVGATDINSLQLNWGTLGGSAGLRQLSAVGSVYSATPTAAQNYSATDITKNMTSGSVPSQFNRTIDVIDGAGALKTLNFAFLKTGTNTWAVEVAAKNASDVTLPTAQIAHGIATFNGDGTLASVSPSLSTALTIPWAVGAASTITLNLGTAGPIYGTPNATVIGQGDGLSQYSNPYQVRSITQNGSVAGENATISIDESGYLIGNYTNGSVRRLYKIPLAEFISPDKLQAVSGNIFQQSKNSGNALYFQPGTAQESIIQSSALENSNVDLSNELSNMIIAQRAYQSNSKLITTSDNMLDTLTKMT